MTENRREKFGRFYDGLAKYLSETHPSVGLFGYGSYFEKPNQEPGDIDGGIIMPTVVTDKESVLDISKQIALLLKGIGIRKNDVQLNLLDTPTSIDGRFLSYSLDYCLYIQRHGRDLTGNCDFDTFKGIDNKFSILGSAAYNFRRVRNNFLMSHSTLQESEVEAATDLERMIDKLKRIPRKASQIKSYGKEEDTRYEKILADLKVGTKEDFVRCLTSIVGEIDLGFFDQIKAYEDHEIVANLVKNRQALFWAWAYALSTFEAIVEGYIKHNPPLEVQVRTVI